MNKLKNFFPIICIVFFCWMSLTIAHAQQPENPRPQIRAEANYEVMFHILTASNKPSGKNNIPQSLSNVVKKLKSQFAFSDYHLDSTYLQRVTSSVEIKDVANDVNDQNQSKTNPIFTEFSLANLSNFPSAQGKKSVQFQVFRYGQRVPVQNSAGSVNYEQVGITLRKLNLTENVPTIIGSLVTSNPDEMMFLVMTATADEQ